MSSEHTKFGLIKLLIVCFVLLIFGYVLFLQFGQSVDKSLMSNQNPIDGLGSGGSVTNLSLPVVNDSQGQVNKKVPSNWKDEVITVTVTNSVDIGNVSVEQNKYSIDTSTRLATLLGASPSASNDSGSDASTDSAQQYQQLQASVFDYCGRVAVPTTESSISRFVADLEDNYTVNCIGKAIVENCSGARADLSGSGLTGYLYIAERNDGVCGVGVSEDNILVTLCSVEDFMNASMHEKKTFVEWQEIIRQNPGQVLKDAYYSSLDASGDSATLQQSNESDCAIFELPPVY